MLFRYLIQTHKSINGIQCKIFEISGFFSVQKVDNLYKFALNNHWKRINRGTLRCSFIFHLFLAWTTNCCFQRSVPFPVKNTKARETSQPDIWTLQLGFLTPDCTSQRVWVRMILKTAWDRLLSSFMLVAATVRDLLPSDIKDSMS